MRAMLAGGMLLGGATGAHAWTIEFPAHIKALLVVGDILHESPLLCAFFGMALAIGWRAMARLPVRPLTRWMALATMLTPLLCAMGLVSVVRRLMGDWEWSCLWHDWAECVFALAVGWAAGCFRGLRTRPPLLRPWP
jgi:hypothetical protein